MKLASAFTPGRRSNAVEARYLAGLLNSKIIDERLARYSMRGSKSFGTPSLIDRLDLPAYDPTSQMHLALADVAGDCETETCNGSPGRLDRTDEFTAQIETLSREILASAH